ncbi:acetylcholinesterase [Purpureocillium lavendulum]|uniref:Carboxylic ester hydrolase n=1 Tax=Purpureocillium lavendulum TaxID=1247861 RepID=A0AB34FSP9_9HYPO|nr:acetylcholinesterase [Purpureocillium lavendulum]
MILQASIGTISSVLAPIASSIAGNVSSPGIAPPSVALSGIGSVSGIRVNETLSGHALPHPVDAWLGVDYAIQPTGENRFRPIQGVPAAFADAFSADKYGLACTQDPDYIPLDQQGEACLNFNVYRPADVPLTQKLPTLVWIHGGGFVLYSAKSMDGASFVSSSREPVMVVTFNYRLNSFGFLPSKLFERQGLLNLGLQDQTFFLEFLQQHLAEFGGDPTQVTLGGLSAGAHSTAIQYFHDYGTSKGKPLFSRALLESGAVTARAFPPVDYPRYGEDFARLMKHIGCPTDVSDAQQLRCLRKAPARDIEQITSEIYAVAESQLNWPWQPALGGARLERPGSRSLQEGTFHHLPIITTHTTDEGKLYTPGNLQTNDDFIEFWHRMSPDLNITDLAILNDLYPDPVAHPDSAWAKSPNSTQYNRISASWSDMAYICPSRQTAQYTSSAGVPTWRLRFNTPANPLEAQAWKGIPHASDMAYLWNDPAVPFKETARRYHAYLASFVATGDPNKLREGDAVEWPAYEADGSAAPRQVVVNPESVDVEEDAIRVRQCEFWNDMDRAQRLNK